MTEDIVIVGGGPAGLAAARSYREAGGRAPVHLFTPEARAPYFRPSLSKEFLRGEETESDLPLTEDGWWAQHDVELHLQAPVTGLNTDARTIDVTGAGPRGYGACVLATGSEPMRLPVEGGDNPDLLLLRSVEDSQRIAGVTPPGSTAVVVGSGFIGCEAAASLRRRGVIVVQVTDEEAPQTRRLGSDVGARLAAWLRDEGVDLRTARPVDGFHRDGDGWRVVFGGEEVAADAVLVAVGVRRRSQLAAAAGLRLDGPGVATDASMHTTAPGVFAVGDVAHALNAAAGRPLLVEHWGEAENMGAVAGRVLAGEQARWDTAPGFWSQIGDRTLKYVAWGDGYDEVRVDGDADAWTAWYGSQGTTVGVLTHERDEDYERGRELVESGASLPRN